VGGVGRVGIWIERSEFDMQKYCQQLRRIVLFTSLRWLERRLSLPCHFGVAGKHARPP
jgi:hypothetical protein